MATKLTTEDSIKTLKYKVFYLSDYDTFDETFDGIKNLILNIYIEKQVYLNIGCLLPIEIRGGVNVK